MEIVAKNGMVAAAHPIAAENGLRILKKGGNAIDAAVATAFTLDLVDPGDSGIGGRGSMVIYLAESDEIVVVDYNTVCPKKATPDIYEVIPTKEGEWWSVKDNANSIGYKAVSLPTTLLGLCLALENYGRMTLKDVMQPAIEVAKRGYEINQFIENSIKGAADKLRLFPASSRIFLPEGRAPVRGERLAMKDYAKTLTKIAEGGPDVFYKGEIARIISKEMEANDGLITYEDLAGYEAQIVKPTSTSYHGYEFFPSTPTCSGGSFTLQTLNILENFDLPGMGYCTPASIHVIAEALKLAWADRLAYVADPQFAKVPTAGILSKTYARKLKDKINLERAVNRAKPGDPWKYNNGGSPDAGNTTHISVIDKERNMMALTQTLCDWFGSGVTIPRTGIVMNNGMKWFNPNPGTPNSIEPGKKPLNNQCETVVTRNGTPFMTLGTPGGRRILSTITLMSTNVVDYNLGTKAVAAPRFHIEDKEPLLIEQKWQEDIPGVENLFKALKKMGHKIQLRYGPGTHISGPASLIMVDSESHELKGAADPRQPGAAAGY